MTKNRGFQQKIEGMNGKIYDIETGNLVIAQAGLL
jgi:hypothetical protein